MKLLVIHLLLCIPFSTCMPAGIVSKIASGAPSKVLAGSALRGTPSPTQVKVAGGPTSLHSDGDDDDDDFPIASDYAGAKEIDITAS